MSAGELTKLKITAYKDDTFQEEVENGTFHTLLNPEKYAESYKVEYSDQQASGTSAAQPSFVRIPPQDLELEFLFDRSGVIKGHDNKNGEGVLEDIDHFKHVVFDYDGDQHKPNYLLITWGNLLFKGLLTEMGIEYKLFSPDGKPLRAVARAKFKESVEEELRVAQENNNSPDLTHVRIVKEGDTLPLMSNRIYGDSRYYLQVARANGISNFRKLVAGQEIYFPPVKKAE
ncbi:MAG: hypothetical protein CL868_14960 [Cytophagaceae bacterium]|nr:hypothetical protein [Cytophagaceae bacterium]|tara:strand:+ start:496 stop:1185 length:690 start_codon:yes stop_codon:yes gene_type:complete